MKDVRRLLLDIQEFLADELERRETGDFPKRDPYIAVPTRLLKRVNKKIKAIETAEAAFRNKTTPKLRFQ